MELKKDDINTTNQKNPDAVNDVDNDVDVDVDNDSMLQIQNNRICKFHWLIFMIK